MLSKNLLDKKNHHHKSKRKQTKLSTEAAIRKCTSIGCLKLKKNITSVYNIAFEKKFWPAKEPADNKISGYDKHIKKRIKRKMQLIIKFPIIISQVLPGN